MMVIKIKKAIPVRNIHFTNRGKFDFLFIKKIYVIKFEHRHPKAVAAKVNI